MHKLYSFKTASKRRYNSAGTRYKNVPSFLCNGLLKHFQLRAKNGTRDKRPEYEAEMLSTDMTWRGNRINRQTSPMFTSSRMPSCQTVSKFLALQHRTHDSSPLDPILPQPLQRSSHLLSRAFRETLKAEKWTRTVVNSVRYVLLFLYTMSGISLFCSKRVVEPAAFHAGIYQSWHSNSK